MACKCEGCGEMVPVSYTLQYKYKRWCVDCQRKGLVK